MYFPLLQSGIKFGWVWSPFAQTVLVEWHP